MISSTSKKLEHIGVLTMSTLCCTVSITHYILSFFKKTDRSDSRTNLFNQTISISTSFQIPQWHWSWEFSIHRRQFELGPRCMTVVLKLSFSTLLTMLRRMPSKLPPFEHRSNLQMHEFVSLDRTVLSMPTFQRLMMRCQSAAIWAKIVRCLTIHHTVNHHLRARFHILVLNRLSSNKAVHAEVGTQTQHQEGQEMGPTPIWTTHRAGRMALKGPTVDLLQMADMSLREICRYGRDGGNWLLF